MQWLIHIVLGAHSVRGVLTGIRIHVVYQPPHLGRNDEFVTVIEPGC